jgi:hypothetical protein
MEKFFKQGSESEPDVAGSALTIMRERGGRWAAYQNFALDSRGLGNVVFVQYGPGRTFETPPPAAPDGAHGAGWRYLHVGYVDLETGNIVEVEK